MGSKDESFDIVGVHGKIRGLEFQGLSRKRGVVFLRGVDTPMHTMGVEYDHRQLFSFLQKLQYLKANKTFFSFYRISLAQDISPNKIMELTNYKKLVRTCFYFHYFLEHQDSTFKLHETLVDRKSNCQRVMDLIATKRTIYCPY